MTNSKFLAETLIEIGEKTAELKDQILQFGYKEEEHERECDHLKRELQKSIDETISLKNQIKKSSDYNSELFSVLMQTNEIFKSLHKNFDHGKEVNNKIKAVVDRIEGLYNIKISDGEKPSSLRDLFNCIKTNH